MFVHQAEDVAELVQDDAALSLANNSCVFDPAKIDSGGGADACLSGVSNVAPGSAFGIERDSQGGRVVVVCYAPERNVGVP